MTRILATMLVLGSLSPVHAQRLDLPTVVFAAAATADWVTTYQNRELFQEANPMIAWLDDRPVVQVALGASIDLAGVYVWHRFTRQHTRLRAIGLYSMSAMRIYFAVQNARARHHAVRAQM